MKTIIALLLALLASAATAHGSSTAYLALQRQDDASWLVTWRVALRDADVLLDLDADADGRLTWGEVEDRGQDLAALMREHVALRAGDVACKLDIDAPAYAGDADTAFVQLSARARCGEAALSLHYSLFEGIDASHRALLRVGAAPPRPLAPGDTVAVDSVRRTSDLLLQGIGHILGGIDHLLFLIALLLPAVLVRRAGCWQPHARWRKALLNVAWIATAFTAAHSVTLALASLGVLRMPAALVEPLIALTVLLAALNNLWPVVERRLALVAFCFGLIHGFGFAEVLAPLRLPPLQLAQALLEFNLGVEIGQLAVVSTSFVLLALAARWRGYPRWVLGAGSVAVAMVAIGWIVERTLDVPVFAPLLAG